MPCELSLGCFIYEKYLSFSQQEIMKYLIDTELQKTSCWSHNIHFALDEIVVSL
jgi:hypothetical protein